MSPKEAFKVGFLAYCADRGLGGEQAAALMRKAAEFMQKRALGLNDAADWAAGTAGWAGKGLANAALTAGIGLPVMAGAGLGYLAHRAAVPEVDDDDIKRQELIEELKHYARRAREQQRVKALRASGV